MSANRDLKKITLHGCKLFTDYTLVAIARSCPKLQALSYSNKTRLQVINYVRRKFPEISMWVPEQKLLHADITASKHIVTNTFLSYY